MAGKTGLGGDCVTVTGHASPELRMLSKLIIAFLLMAACVAIHAMGLIAAFRWLEVRMARRVGDFWWSVWRLVRIASWTVFLHLLQILSWAFLYAVRGAMPDFTTAAYFSAVTPTPRPVTAISSCPGMAAGRRCRSAHRDSHVRPVHRHVLCRLLQHFRPRPKERAPCLN